MSGVYSSVQERIKEHLPNAVYVHCVCHRLNLVLPEMKTFFGTVEEVYKFFGYSAPNWALLKAFGSDSKVYTLKHLTSTRWESRHKSVSTLIGQYPIILKTLAHLNLSSLHADVRRSAERLTECITKMEFLVPLLMWEKILRAI